MKTRSAHTGQLNLFSAANFRRAELDRREKLLKLLRDYVLHKKRIISSSRSKYYQRKPIRESLEVLERYLGLLPGYKLKGICRVIQVHEDDLRNILPAEENPSYKSSVEKLNHLIQLSHEYNS